MTARQRVALLVAGGHRDLVHSGLHTQQELADMAGRSGLFSVLDGPDGTQALNVTPCSAGKAKWSSDLAIAVRFEASGPRATEGIHEQVGVLMRAAMAGLTTGYFGGDISSIDLSDGFGAPEPFYGTGDHPVALIATLRAKIVYYA